MKNKINLKIKILLILSQFILITINPFLTLTFFETFFIRMLLFNTRYSFLGPHARLEDEQNINELGLEDENFALILTLQIQNIINPENNIPGVNDNELIIDDNDSNVQNEEDAIQDALDDETEAIAAEEEQWEQLLQDLSAITGEPVEDLRNRLNVENSNPSFNPEEIIATSTPNTIPNELDVNTNSDMSESIIPFLLILIHQNMLTKFNKFKTKWSKLVTTPIIIGTVKRGRQSNILKYIKYLSIFLTFLSLILLSLLFYPPLLENITINYLLLNLTIIFDYITNHFYKVYYYCRDLYNIFNLTDNTSKIITPETKLIDDVNNDNNEIMDNKDNIESTPFYKTKTFIICGIIILTSALIYLYCNNLLPFTSEYNIYDTQRIDHLLDIISKKENQYNILRVEHLKLLEQKNSLMVVQGKYLELINNFQILKEGLEQNVTNLQFIGDNLEHLVSSEDSLGHLTDSSDFYHFS
jgi:hypothetical protein